MESCIKEDDEREKRLLSCNMISASQDSNTMSMNWVPSLWSSSMTNIEDYSCWLQSFALNVSLLPTLVCSLDELQDAVTTSPFGLVCYRSWRRILMLSILTLMNTTITWCSPQTRRMTGKRDWLQLILRHLGWSVASDFCLWLGKWYNSTAHLHRYKCILPPKAIWNVATYR